MNFRIVIDGTEIQDEPKELESWQDEARFERELNTVLTTFPNSLTFIGDGYTFLRC